PGQLEIANCQLSIVNLPSPFLPFSLSLVIRGCNAPPEPPRRYNCSNEPKRTLPERRSMPAVYRDLLERIRLGFTRPVSDKINDSYFVHSILRALDRVDDLKSNIPLLGAPTEPDYDAARRARLSPESSTVEEVTAELVRYLQGMTIYSHPRVQGNVLTQPSIASLIGVLLAALYNPNLCWDEHSRQIDGCVRTFP